MAKKVALVLSGGGGKGAFQVGAEKYLREEKGYRWNVISGVSIGAINGAFLAMGAYARLEEIWNSVTPQMVFGKRIKLRAAAGILRGRPSLFNLDGMDALLQELDPDKMTTPLIVGAVSLVTGEFIPFRSTHPDFRNALRASAALPLIFPPVDVSEHHPAMVDGGTRNLTPLGTVLADEPDEIVVINCSSRAALKVEAAPKSAIAISQRAFEIAMHQIFTNDVGKFDRMNRLVAQATAQGAVLRNNDGRPFKRYPLTIIEPDVRLGETTDFSRAQVRRALEAGWE
ncbi:MAG TPA: patatin-like phospholipase family protein, partial [Candidatus Binatia bacterium]|nr:patatin-like phospholipase family protein [Candidatus Binatia bacterium]